MLVTTLAAPPAVASDEPAGASAITTVLHPGYNLIAWLGSDASADDIFDQVPNLERISAWDGGAQDYRRRTRTSVPDDGLERLKQGSGVFLYVVGDSPVEWTREASDDSMLLDLHAGRNLVGWAGRDGTPIEEAVVRFGAALTRAWLWDAETQRYLHYRPGRPEHAHPLRELNHGDALWVELSAGARWWQSGTAPPPVVILGELAEARASKIWRQTDEARGAFVERWTIEASFTAYVGGLSDLDETYRSIYGRAFPQYCGTYGRGLIFIRDDCFNSRTISREYFHAIQDHLSQGRYLEAPPWLIEGSATYAEQLHLGISSVARTIDEQLDQYRDWAKYVIVDSNYPPLPEVAWGAVHQRGFLAVDWLVEHSTEESPLEFFKMLADSASFEEAFEGAFGMDIGEFYDSFEAYRNRVAPRLPHTLDQSSEPILVFGANVPAETEVAVQTEFDRLQNFFTKQLAAGAVDYTMFVVTDEQSGGPAHQALFGRGTYCNTSNGRETAAAINLRCPSVTYHLVYPHFVATRAHLAPLSSMPLGSDGKRTRGPAWLDAAWRYLESRYLDVAGHEVYENSRGIDLSLARGIATPLSSMTTRDGFYGQAHAEARGVAVLAIEWLTERVGDPAIFDYYRRLPDSASWEEAFEAAFGIAVDDFYVEFEAYRARVAPPNADADSS